MPAQKGRVGKQTVPNAVLLPRIPVRVEQEPQPTEKEETYFFSSRAGWVLSLEDTNCDISAFILYYELDYQIRALDNKGCNDIHMKVDILMIFKVDPRVSPWSSEVMEQ